MKRLLLYLRRYWLRYALGIAFTLVTAVVANVLPILIRDAINAISFSHGARLPEIAIAMAVLALLGGGARWCSRFTIFNTGRQVEYDLRGDLFTHLLGLSPDFYQRLKTGDLMSRMVNDLTAIRMLAGMGILMITNAPLYYALALSLMVWLSPRLTLASVVPYLLLFFAVRRLTRVLMERSLKVQEELGAIEAKVQESLAGIHVVKAYTVEDHEAARFRELNDDYNELGLALARMRGAMMPLVRSAVACSAMIVLIYGGSLVMRHRISIGDLVAFLQYLGILAFPTTQMGWMVSMYQRGKAAMKRLEQIFSEEPTAAIEGPEEKVEIAGAVRWEGVSFSYLADGALNSEPKTWALRDINVSVPAGQKLAIVGRTGSGKSTMLKLLSRLAEPTRGRVTIDGRDLRDLPLGALRRTFGVVPQEPILFSDTIAHNIAFGRADATLAEIENAARTAGLESDIAVLPQGFDTVVGERGMSLSGGQKQRVTIARLLTYDPSVVVLDDALSSVDTETERIILQSLSQSVAGRTTIVVAHRASTVRDADQIIVLEEGRVAERGTHAQLMAQRGIYAELFRRQLLEEELASYQDGGGEDTGNNAGR